MTNVHGKRKRVTISQQKASIKTTKLINLVQSTILINQKLPIKKRIIQNIPNEFLKFILNHLFLLTPNSF